MSQENVDLIREMYLAFHGGDAARALSYFSEDVVVDATARIDGGIGNGREELSRIIGQWLATFDDWHEHIEQIRDLGNQVYVVAVQRGRGKDQRDRDANTLRDHLRGSRPRDHPHDSVSRTRRGPRSRRAAGVGERRRTSRRHP